MNWVLKVLAQRKIGSHSQNQPRLSPPEEQSLQMEQKSETSTVCSMSVETHAPRGGGCALEIPGVGVVPTSWVGEKGRQNIWQNFVKDTDSAVVADLKKELRILSTTCLKAFDKFANKEEHSLPDVQTAIKLCQQNAPKRKSSHQPATAPVAKMWKGACNSFDGVEPAEDKVKLARHVLGDTIVSTIREEHKDPPHVSIAV